MVGVVGRVRRELWRAASAAVYGLKSALPVFHACLTQPLTAKISPASLPPHHPADSAEC